MRYAMLMLVVLLGGMQALARADDAPGNVAEGRRLCFELGKWDQGLALLRQGPDETLRALSQSEDSVNDTAIARIVMGHDWWDWGAAQKNDPIAKVRAQERAAYWYERGLAEASGDQQDRLRGRIAQVETEAQAAYAALGTVRPVDGDRVAWQRAIIEEAETLPLAGEEISKPRKFEAGKRPYTLTGEIAVAMGEPVALTFDAGCEIRGGTIDLRQRGNAIIKGTKDLPVVFRNVTFLQDLGGSLTAEFAVFDRCTFAKGGVWFSEFSSKWTMSDCVLHACTFPKLTRVDYGFRLTRCALVAMKFPEMANERPADFDHMIWLRSDWTKIDACDFLGCAVPPTVAWCATGSNFVGCTFAAGEQFDSAKAAELKMFVAETVGDEPQKVWDTNSAKREKLTVAAAEKPFSTTAFGGNGTLPEVRVEQGRVRLLVGRDHSTPSENPQEE